MRIALLQVRTARLPMRCGAAILLRVKRALGALSLGLAGMAWGGVVAGHLLAYAVAHPHPAIRHEQLAVTGHGSFHAMLLLAALSSGLGLASAGVRSLRGRAVPRGSSTALVLAAIQIPAFALMDLAERGFSLSSFVTDPAVPLGLVLQVVFALVLSRLMRVVAWAVRSVTRGRRRSLRVADAAACRDDRAGPRAADLIASRPLRAPPEAAAA